ncbi:MAG: carbohydrate-binding protein [Clostridiaceae bacterium]|nr:carbohydrate-binding protein [Clostridiaceae bacterium]
MNEVADVMTDPSPKYGRDHGWHASFVRVNTDSVGGWTSERGLVDSNQFDAWIENFLVPYANHLKTRGLYLVLSATGPMVVNIDGDQSKNTNQGTQERMMTFWERVSSAPGVKDADNIMFELMNEPVMIESEPGNGEYGMAEPIYFERFTKWLQPIIDVVRDTGANNVIWVPTLEWQGSPHQWLDYPFTGENIGVAVHYYPAYGGVFDIPRKVLDLWGRQYRQVAKRWPMIITEMFWTPMPDDPRNLVNGTTEGFGNSIKQIIDDEGNVSFMIGFIGDLLDDLDESRPSEADLSEREGAQAYFDWMPELAETSIRSYGYRPVPGRFEAEQYESMKNLRVESNSENFSNRHIAYITSDSWAKYLIDVKESGTYTATFRVATDVQVDNDILIKDGSGKTLATFTVDSTKTNAWQDWYTDSVTIELSEGKQELTLEFKGDSEYLFNIDWIELEATDI